MPTFLQYIAVTIWLLKGGFKDIKVLHKSSNLHSESTIWKQILYFLIHIASAETIAFNLEIAANLNNYRQDQSIDFFEQNSQNIYLV